MNSSRARLAKWTLVVTSTFLLSLAQPTTPVLARSLVQPADAAICRASPAPSQASLTSLSSSAAFAGYNQGIDMRDDEGYNADYLFAMTKGVASAPMTPALKPLLFLFTVPLDIVLLPFTAIAGFF